MTASADLDGALATAAGAAVLLVAVDFDGTIAPLVVDRDAAAPLPAAAAALADLAGLPRTTVAVVSGRARDDLRARLGAMAAHTVLIGSHGAETAAHGPDHVLDRPGRRRLIDVAAAAAAGLPSVDVERKPHGVAVHYRGAARSDAARALHRLRRGIHRLRAEPTAPPIGLLRGHCVVELTLATLDKGDAIEWLRNAAAAEVVVFAGDDRTDERAFAALRPGDIGIKVGRGASRAGWRLADPAATAALLGRLAALRRRALQTSTSQTM